VELVVVTIVAAGGVRAQLGARAYTRSYVAMQRSPYCVYFPVASQPALARRTRRRGRDYVFARTTVRGNVIADL